MEKKRLLETLEELRTELAQSERVDPQTLAQLKKLADELHQELNVGDDTKPTELEPARGLKDMLLEFEAEHPQLSVTIGKVADALAAMGI